ncbi:MAG: amidohydrolase family protein [Gemmatimonadales bacterium]
MRTDVNAFLGHYPFRRVEGGSPGGLVQAMARHGIDRAWVSNLGSLYWKDPTEGNAILFKVAEGQESFRPVPAIHPGLANWRAVLAEAVARRAPAIRVDPLLQGIAPDHPELEALAHLAAEAGVPMLMAVRLEDGRQRHPNDRTGELEPWMVRRLIRRDPALRLIVTHADRDFIEQVHYGSTVAEAERLLWDICWIWGPPMDDLAHLVATIGAARFAFGTGMPLRIPESSAAKLELLDLPAAELALIESGNAAAFAAG